jgi:hypothetical protein
MSTHSLNVDNRIQMFIYYNTLAWQILAATIAAVIALGTLPFVVVHNIGRNFMYFIFNEGFAFAFFLGGVLLFYRIRAYAVRWVQLRNEDYPHSLRILIDQVETGYQVTAPARGTTTNLIIIWFVSLGIVYFVISGALWFLLA